MTVYGLVPVGGKGIRLGLPFPKELLPQKGYLEYKPLIAHTTEKMEEAGAEVIYFIHGSELKQGIVEYYSDFTKYVHVIQKTPGFANVIKDFYHASNPLDDDEILFGLPDSVYDDNPFKNMVRIPGIVCGIFHTTPETRVDRLRADGNGFAVKSEENLDTSKWFWGVIKFDGKSTRQITDVLDNNSAAITKHTEIGSILNRYLFKTVYAGKYLDLGTWINYNKYLIDYRVE